MAKNVQKRPKFVFKAKIIPLNAPSGRVSIAQIKAETQNFHVALQYVLQQNSAYVVKWRKIFIIAAH